MLVSILTYAKSVVNCFAYLYSDKFTSKVCNYLWYFLNYSVTRLKL
jgi:hypothetical protein